MKTTLINSILFVSSLLSSCSLFADNSFNLEIRLSKDSILVLLLNESGSEKWINKRFALGDNDDLSEISLIIMDENNKVYDYTTNIKTRLLRPEKEDLVLLYPNMFVGSKYFLEDISRLYLFGPGVYKIKAVYKNEFKYVKEFRDNALKKAENMGPIFTGTIDSNWIEVVIDEQDWIKGKIGVKCHIERLKADC